MVKVKEGFFKRQEALSNDNVLLAHGGHKPLSEFKIGDYLPIAGGTMTGNINFAVGASPQTANGIYFSNGSHLGASGNTLYVFGASGVNIYPTPSSTSGLEINASTLKYKSNTVLDSGNSSVDGGGSTWGASITVKINNTEKTLQLPSDPNRVEEVTGSTNKLVHYKTDLLIGPVTATIGASDNPIWINGGVPTASGASVGSAGLPIYLSSGKITPITGSQMFSAFGSTGTTGTYITIAGHTRTLQIPYATSAGKLSTNAGSTTQAIYFANGVPTALTGTTGAANQPIYLNAGKFTPITYKLNATVLGNTTINRLVHYSSATEIGPVTGTIGASNNPIWINEGVPTASGASVGSAGLPIYLSSGKITAITGSQMFSAFGSTGTTGTYITIAGHTRALQIQYATSAGKLSINAGSTTQAIYFSNGIPTALTGTTGAANQPIYLNGGKFTPITYKLNATVLGNTTINRLVHYSSSTEIGPVTATIGASNNPIWINAGVPTASGASVGSATNGIYLAGGVLTKMTYNLNATVNAGTANKLAYYSSATAISAYTSTAGGAILPIYLNAGVPTANSIYRYHYDSNEDFATYKYHKVAYATNPGNFADWWVRFSVNCGYGTEGLGELYIRLRTNGNGVIEGYNINWLVRSSGLNVDNFKLLYTNDTTNKTCTVEFWCIIPGRWQGYTFRIIDSGNRGSNGYLSWVLCDSNGGHGATALPSVTATINSSDLASAYDNRYVLKAGDTMTGSLILKGTTTNTMTWGNIAHPLIRFDNADSSQMVALAFTDYDSYRYPAGIKLIGNMANAWFEAPVISIDNTLNTGGATGSALQVKYSSFNQANYLYAENILVPNDVAGSKNIILVGKANSTANQSYFGYVHVADGSTLNYATIGLYARDQLFNIQAGGNVGIGTTAPAYKLHVAGNGYISTYLGVAMAPRTDYKLATLSAYVYGATVSATYYGRTIAPNLNTGVIYLSACEATTHYMVNRNTAGGGYYLHNNNIEYAHLFVSTVGTAASATAASKQGLALFAIGNSIPHGATGTTTGANNARGYLRIFATNQYYTDIASQGNGNHIVYLPNHASSMYLVHAANNNAVGSATKPVYIAANGRVTEGTHSLEATVNAGTANRIAYYSSATAISAASTLISDGTYIHRAAVSSSWNNSDDNSMIYQNTIAGLGAVLSLKTTGGHSWSIAHYDNAGYHTDLLFGFLHAADHSGATAATNRWRDCISLIPVTDAGTSRRAFVTANYTRSSATNGTAAVGNSTTPVYVNAKGIVVAGQSYAGYGDSRYVKKAGDTMTGTLTMSAANILVSYTNANDANVRTTNSNGSIGILSSTNRGLYDHTKSAWVIATNGTNTWLSQGNVGIGNTAPGYKLDVSGTVRATDNISITAKTKGYFLTDKNSFTYPLGYDNGSNLWIGSAATQSKHHTGQTYISAGYSGTAGNSTIYVCVPNAANNNGTNYEVYHSGYHPFLNSGTAGKLAYYSAALVISQYTTTVGTSAKPIYMSAGVPTALTATIGTSARPIYMSGGAMAACSASIGTSARAIYMSGGVMTALSASIGTSTKPIYMSGGVITASAASVGSSIRLMYLASGVMTAGATVSTLKGSFYDMKVLWCGICSRSSYSSTTWSVTKKGGLCEASASYSSYQVTISLTSVSSGSGVSGTINLCSTNVTLGSWTGRTGTTSGNPADYNRGLMVINITSQTSSAATFRGYARSSDNTHWRNDRALGHDTNSDTQGRITSFYVTMFGYLS